MKKFSYKKSGVDLNFANAIVPRIKKLVAETRRPEVVKDIGPFAALFKLKKYKNPVLVSSADGVGTKLQMALRLGILETVGIDLVAMNVNDVLAMGAEPLFFLDYIGIGRDQKKLIEPLVRGMAKGAKMAGAALVGGETAEMPGTYGGKRLGLAGFAVGVAEERAVIDGSKIKAGDIILGLASSGLHANGFSLVNRVLKPDKKLLTPTRIYVRSVLPVLKRFSVHGLAHITGGGLYDNISRILPRGLDAKVDSGAWLIPKIFRDIQKKSGISTREMFHTFNMGIGFVLIVPQESARAVASALSKSETVFYIGAIIKGSGRVIIE